MSALASTAGRVGRSRNPLQRRMALAPVRPTALLILALAWTGAALSQSRQSARELLSPELRAMQADDGANPGMLWVERGARLWHEPAGGATKSCASCHGDATATMKGVATRYPAIDGANGRLLNLEGRINGCRGDHMAAPELPYESTELLALTAYVAHQSRGLPMSVAVDGPAAPFFAAGEAFFHQRQGQLNLACGQCHDGHVGGRLRGDLISSGLATGYPAYRLEWQSLGSLHRRLRACALGVRAHQFAAGAPEYVNLELYLAWRARGLALETPGVRK